MADRFTDPRQIYYSIKDAAEMLNVSTRTVRRLIKSEALPAYKAGHQVRIRRFDLQAYMQARRWGHDLHVL